MKESDMYCAIRLEHQEAKILQQDNQFIINVKRVAGCIVLVKLLSMWESKF